MSKVSTIRTIFLLVLSVLLTKPASAQWQSSGNDIYYNNGKVGIGISSPLKKLHIENGSMLLRSTGNDWWSGLDMENLTGRAVLRLKGKANVNNVNVTQFSMIDTDEDKSWSITHSGYNASMPNSIGFSSTDENNVYTVPFRIGFHAPTNSFVITSDGKIGISTASPSHKLSVNGTIRAREIIVNNTGWADFVFEESYKLKSLEEVESFIKTNRHLPEIPSAEEVETNGVSVGKMQSKLLQKIEELTLYLIEIKAENKELKKEVAKLTQR